MCLTYRRCDTKLNYISPVAQNLRSNLFNKTDGSLVRIAQVARIDPVAAWRCLRAKISSNKGT